MSVDFAVVQPTERDGIFIADFSAERARLGKAQVMRIARHAAADETGLPGDELPMLFVAKANGLSGNWTSNTQSLRA